MQAADCSGMSGLNCCWASSLRGFLRYSSLPRKSPHGWDLSPPCGEFYRVDGRPGDSRRTVSTLSFAAGLLEQAERLPVS